MPPSCRRPGRGYGLTREIGWLNREIGPKTVRAHNKSCPAALWDGPACRCSIFFGGNFVAAPDIAQNPAAPPTIAFRTIPGAAHARGASAASTSCPSTLPSRPPCCGDRFFAHAPAPGRARTKLPGERQQTAHEIWARRSGHFSMPATALHRSESYLSRPVAPFNAAGRAL